MIKNGHLKLLYLIHASVCLSFATDNYRLNETTSYSSPTSLIFSPPPLTPLSQELLYTWGTPVAPLNLSAGHPYYSSNGSIPAPYAYYSPPPLSPSHSSYYPPSQQDNSGYDGSVAGFQSLSRPVSPGPYGSIPFSSFQQRYEFLELKHANDAKNILEDALILNQESIALILNNSFKEFNIDFSGNENISTLLSLSITCKTNYIRSQFKVALDAYQSKVPSLVSRSKQIMSTLVEIAHLHSLDFTKEQWSSYLILADKTPNREDLTAWVSDFINKIPHVSRPQVVNYTLTFLSEQSDLFSIYLFISLVQACKNLDLPIMDSQHGMRYYWNDFKHPLVKKDRKKPDVYVRSLLTTISNSEEKKDFIKEFFIFLKNRAKNEISAAKRVINFSGLHHSDTKLMASALISVCGNNNIKLPLPFLKENLPSFEKSEYSDIIE